MGNLVKRIQKNLPDECLERRKKPRKESCSVSLENAPDPYVMIDIDKQGAPVDQNKTRCDYIFIGGCEVVWLMPLELMGGKPDPSKIVRQLQAGADVAADVIIPKGEQVEFQPVAFCGGKFHRTARVQLAKSANKIRFRGQQINSRLLRCGKSLTEALPKKNKK